MSYKSIIHDDHTCIIIVLNYQHIDNYIVTVKLNEFCV